MIRPAPAAEVYLYSEPVDMRKSIDGLSALVEQEIDLSPFADVIFVFCNRGRDKIKLLHWERNGFVVWYKRLEKQRFTWNRSFSDPVILDGQTLNSLLDGLDIWGQKPHEILHLDSVL
jgi:transposase